MAIKLGKAAIGTYVRTGKSESSDREVLDFVPAGMIRGVANRARYMDPVNYPRYVIDAGPNSYQNYKTVKTKTYIKYAKAAETA